MIRVNLVEIAPAGGHNTIIEMPAVPRVGDYIALIPDDAAEQVRSVTWTPGNPRYDVQVRFR